MSTFAETIDATPVFNTVEIPFRQLPLKKDDQKLIRATETILFPGTKCRIVKELSDNVIQIETEEYPSHNPLYADRRFFKDINSKDPEREKKLPSSQTILNRLEGLVGTRYFWGGIWENGIDHMLEVYPQLQEASAEDQDDAICKGVDCSGLLYRVTNGITPRNTSDLIKYGEELPLQDLSAKEVQEQLKPLDLLVWKGHILIVLTPSTLIESRGGDGVVISDFLKRYAEITQLLKQQNKTLYFRRWHPDFLQKN